MSNVQDCAVQIPARADGAERRTMPIIIGIGGGVYSREAVFWVPPDPIPDPAEFPGMKFRVGVVTFVEADELRGIAESIVEQVNKQRVF